MPKRRKSIANSLELRPSCTNPSTWCYMSMGIWMREHTSLFIQKALSYSLIFVTQYNDVIMGVIASQIISLRIIYSNIYSGTAHRKHQSSLSLASVMGIHRWPMNFLHKGPVTRKMFPFDDIFVTDLMAMTRTTHTWPYQKTNYDCNANR